MSPAHNTIKAPEKRGQNEQARRDPSDDQELPALPRGHTNLIAVLINYIGCFHGHGRCDSAGNTEDHECQPVQHNVDQRAQSARQKGADHG